MHQLYSTLLKREKPDFIVKYKTISFRIEKRLFQGMRTNFMYAEDVDRHQAYIIFPEFLDEKGKVIIERGPIDLEGTANMWIIFPEMIDLHKTKLKINGKGFFLEGIHKVAECEIIAIN